MKRAFTTAAAVRGPAGPTAACTRLPDARRKSSVKRIVADPKRCLACRTCELACALAYAASDDLVRDRSLPAGETADLHRIGGAAGRALAVPALRGRALPARLSLGRLWRPDEAGPVLVRQERCIGCAFCVQVCPFGVIRAGTLGAGDASDNGLAIVKCDLCQQQQAAGLPPACVASCPVQARYRWRRWRILPRGCERSPPPGSAPTAMRIERPECADELPEKQTCRPR